MSLAQRPHEIVLWVLHIKWFLWIITRTHGRTNQDEKWFMHASASCFTLTVYETSQFMRLWYLSHMQPAKAQTSLHIRTVLPGA